jgi:uncharacterized protein YoxC
MTPSWVAPTVGISLAIIALAFLAMGTMFLILGVEVRRQLRTLRTQLAGLSTAVAGATARLKAEVDGYADLSQEVRAKVSGAVQVVAGRLEDLDALVEVLQDEVETTALDVAALLRTARRSGAMLGRVRRALSRRRRARV